MTFLGNLPTDEISIRSHSIDDFFFLDCLSRRNPEDIVRTATAEERSSNKKKNEEKKDLEEIPNGIQWRAGKLMHRGEIGQDTRVA